MKIGRKTEGKEKRASSGRAPSGRAPAVNSSKRTIFIVLLAVLAAGLIFWVWNIGKKAEETVTVAVWTQSIYKNQVITSDMMEPYEMLRGEYEKLSIVNNNDGSQSRRVALWSEAPRIVGTFAAYPLQAGNYVEYRTLIQSRVDNTDSVLYSFPGKDIVELGVDNGELQAFKTFLQPGDRINITAIYSENVDVTREDAYGNSVTEQQTVFRSEQAFGDLMVADMLNASGESILDIYAEYNEMTVWQQANLENDSTFRTRTEPNALLVAFTPEELDRYYYFMSKGDVQFRISMPQRMD